MVGGTGGATTTSVIDVDVNSIVTGGGGGGGSGINGRGAHIIGTTYSTNLIPTVSGGTNAALVASSGFISNIPSTNSSVRQIFFNTGGGGGYGTNTSDGGNGGNGGYGSGGGGGGGASTIGRSAGNGGKGGDGLIMITCW